MQPQITVLDAGGQYCHLIARKIRDLGVYADVAPSETHASDLAGRKSFWAGVAFAVFYRRPPDAAALYANGPAWYTFLLRKWYFDEAYDAALVKPTLALAHAAAAADKRPTDADPHAKRFDLFTLDGILNAIGQAADALGGVLRRAQTGRIRTYVAALALTAVVLLGMLAVLAK